MSFIEKIDRLTDNIKDEGLLKFLLKTSIFYGKFIGILTILGFIFRTLSLIYEGRFSKDSLVFVGNSTVIDGISVSILFIPLVLIYKGFEYASENKKLISYFVQRRENQLELPESYVKLLHFSNHIMMILVILFCIQSYFSFYKSGAYIRFLAIYIMCFATLQMLSSRYREYALYLRENDYTAIGSLKYIQAFRLFCLFILLVITFIMTRPVLSILNFL